MLLDLEDYLDTSSGVLPDLLDVWFDRSSDCIYLIIFIIFGLCINLFFDVHLTLNSSAVGAPRRKLFLLALVSAMCLSGLGLRGSMVCEFMNQRSLA